jgi:hypothetical protein
MKTRINIDNAQELLQYKLLVGENTPKIVNILIGTQLKTGEDQYISPVFNYHRFQSLLNKDELSDFQKMQLDEYDKIFMSSLLNYGIFITNVQSGDKSKIYLLENKYIAKLLSLSKDQQQEVMINATFINDYIREATAKEIYGLNNIVELHNKDLKEK